MITQRNKMKNFILITIFLALGYTQCTPLEVSVYISEKDGWMFPYSAFYWGMNDGASEIQQFNDDCHQLLENNNACIMDCIYMEQDQLDYNLGRIGCIYYNCPDGELLIQNYEEHAQRPIHLYGELYCDYGTNWNADLDLCQSNTSDVNSDGIVDEFPVINIIGDEVTVLTQTPESNYIDEGASCSDAQDGSINHVVEVSGDVVNLNMIGSYSINYNCTDSDGNEAITQSRTVIVQADFSDEDEDGCDDECFQAGAMSGDHNLDGTLDIIDIVYFVQVILNP